MREQTAITKLEKIAAYASALCGTRTCFVLVLVPLDDASQRARLPQTASNLDLEGQAHVLRKVLESIDAGGSTPTFG